MTSIQEDFGGVSPARLASFEEAHGFALPADYRRFLEEHNGGYPADTRFQIPDIQQEALVQYFCGLGTESPRDLEYWLSKFVDEMPQHFLIIGKDPGGNFIILACDAAEEPGVYYWDHTHFFPQSSDEHNTYFLTASFTEFLGSLLPADVE